MLWKKKDANHKTKKQTKEEFPLKIGLDINLLLAVKNKGNTVVFVMLKKAVFKPKKSR